MGHPVWCEYVCDDCAVTASGMWSSNGRVPTEALKRIAKREGFTFVADTCLCRRCVEKQNAMQPAKTQEGERT